MSQFSVAIFTGNYNHIRDGVALTLNRLVSFLMDNDVEVIVFGPTVEEPALEHVGELVAVPSKSLPGRPEYRVTVAFPAPARKRLAEFKPDIVHIATPDLLGYKARKWAIKQNIPVVASYHTHFSSYLKYYRLSMLEPLLWKYLSWFYNGLKQVYVPSESMADELRAKNFKTDLRIWARGIETGLFSPEYRNKSWRQENGFGENDIVVTFVSRLVWEKNLEIFANVVNKLKKKYPQVKALIVGDGPAAEDTKKMIPDAVFSGFLKGRSLATAYASSDIFFFPSDTETFGNVTLEAMASGLPCVVADATGSKSLVEHGVNGYLAGVEKPDKFYHHIEKLVVDKQLRKTMAGNSVQRAGNYSWDVINRQLLGYYSDVLEAKNQ